MRCGTFGEWSQSVGTHVLHGDPLSTLALPDSEELAEQLDSVWAIFVEVVRVLHWPPVLEPVKHSFGLLMFDRGVNVGRCSEDDAPVRMLSTTKAVRSRHVMSSAPLSPVLVLRLSRRSVETASCAGRARRCTSLHPCSRRSERQKVVADSPCDDSLTAVEKRRYKRTSQ